MSVWWWLAALVAWFGIAAVVALILHAAGWGDPDE